MIRAILVHITIILIIFLLLLRRQSKKEFIINIIIGIWFYYLIYIYIPWSTYGSAYLKFVYGILFIIAFILGIKRIRKINKSKTKIFFRILRFCLTGILVFFMIITTYVDISSRIEPARKIINLAFPLKNGNYYIISGGNNVLLNYHQEYKGEFIHKAFDICKLGKFGSTGVSLFLKTEKNEDVFMFSDSVFSPCDGLITDVIDNEPDHKPGDLDKYIEKQANVVVIKNGNNNVVLVHFKRKSIVVNTGMFIQTGDFIGLVGNSGESSSPHLHIHVRDENWKPVEILFNNKSYIKNDIVRL
jgi:hypothetical protein